MKSEDLMTDYLTLSGDSVDPILNVSGSNNHKGSDGLTLEVNEEYEFTEGTNTRHDFLPESNEDDINRASELLEGEDESEQD